jgi:hypothetical protein
MANLKWPLREVLDLTYYRRAAPFRRSRRLLYIGAPLVAAAWAAAAWRAQDRTSYASGPLSPAHAALARECGACHAQSWRSVGRALGRGAEADRAMNAACLPCHDREIAFDATSATAAHAAPRATTGAAEPFIACAACHAEHESARLAEVADPQCVACHRDLRALRPGAQIVAQAAQIRSFAAREHPDFAFRLEGRGDPGQIHFSHKVHLRKEGVADAARVVHVLRCEDCHRAGPSDAPWPFATKEEPLVAAEAAREPDPEAARMRPIRHALHCAGCHTRTFETLGEAYKAIDVAFPETLAKDLRLARLSVPHDTPAAIRAFLWGRLAESRAAGTSLRRAGAERAPDPLAEVRAEVASIEDWIYAPAPPGAAKSAAICRTCHTLVPAPGPADGAPGAALAPPPSVVPAAIPTRWLAHSSFSHARHRGLACVSCHDAPASERESDVLIPPIDTCRACHVSPEDARGRPRTVASACVLCHAYHRSPGELLERREAAR